MDNKLNICISAVASNQGKTILTSALLYHFKDSVRPFKAGPDFIDPQFHKQICGTDSINLDGFMMNPKQLRWLFDRYSDKDIGIVEGVMGFYDGMDKKSSAYDISKLLNIPTILLLDASGSYITVSAVLKGLKTYKKDNTIKAVVLNRIASQSHYELIRTQLAKDFKDIVFLGWIPNHLQTLEDTHLGLDLGDMGKLEAISKEALKNIDLAALQGLAKARRQEPTSYPFGKVPKSSKKIAVVTDENFSFLYADNLNFLKEAFERVYIISASNDEPIPEDAHSVYICGGYVETNKAYEKIKKAQKFKASLLRHAQSKKIYAECAGLLYLGKSVDEKQMSGILDVSFGLQPRFQRLGYYYNGFGVKGHAFHFTKPIDESGGCDVLSKDRGGVGSIGSWQSKNKKVYGTYLHIFFRTNPAWVKKRLM